MGTILASAIVDRAEIILQDTTNVRWPASELLGWLNEAQRDICAIYPDLCATTANITLVAGTKQSLPAGGAALLKVIRNMGVGGASPGNAMRKVPQEILDSQVPAWHSQSTVTDLKHYIYDPRAPHVFYVYPPSVASNVIEALYSVAPTEMATLATVITIDDVWAGALLDGVLYRAYSKDLAEVGNADRAMLHKAAFDSAMTTKKAVDVSLQPANMVKG